MSETDSPNLPDEGAEEVRWVTVSETYGLVPATIIVGRLRAEGIPARAWQEGAGQATGLIVGDLGTGHVLVPEEYEAAALDILSEEYEVSDWDEEE
jgi:hypothetical protein